MTDFLLDFFEELMAATAIGLFVAFIAAAGLERQ